MPEQQIPKQQTQINETEMSQAIIRAFTELEGKPPTKDQVALLIAQNNLETGHRKYMWNWNVGNISHVPGDGFNYWQGMDWLYDYFPDSSGITQRQKRKVSKMYRAYPDLESGVKDYLQFLKRKSKGAIWDKILEGNPVDFSRELKKQNYYTADEKDYTNGIVAGVNAYVKNNSYEQAMSNHVQPDTTTNNLGYIENMLQKLWQAIASQEVSRHYMVKQAYKNNLLPNDLLIKIETDDLDTSIEFARILCAALDEDLCSDGTIHTDKNNVEIACTVYGPKELSIDATLQLCDVLSETFEEATQKIGGCQVNTIISTNRKSNYQELDISLAQRSYNNFHLRFIEE
jgi:hypothetical protein